MARTFGQRDWLTFCRTTAARTEACGSSAPRSSLLTGTATLTFLRPPDRAGPRVGPYAVAVGKRRARGWEDAGRDAVTRAAGYFGVQVYAAACGLSKRWRPRRRRDGAHARGMLGPGDREHRDGVRRAPDGFVTKGSMDITDGATVALCKYCPRLQILKLGDSPFLTDATLVHLADKGGLPRLKGFRQFDTILRCEVGIDKREEQCARASVPWHVPREPHSGAFSLYSGDEYGSLGV